MRFKEQVVFISGAGKGLGRAIALAFGEEGAFLAINDLTPVNLDETEGQLVALGAKCLAITGDVSKKTQVQSMLEKVMDHYGRLDILVNNAGVEPGGSIVTMDEWDWDRTVAVNLKAPFLMMQSAARIMRDQGQGVIVNIGAAELQGENLARRAAYAASKAGLRTLTQAAALELAPQRIRVNMVAPGPDRLIQPEAGVPQGSARLAAIAEAVLYLSSSQARFITGEVISMNDPVEVD